MFPLCRRCATRADYWLISVSTGDDARPLVRPVVGVTLVVPTAAAAAVDVGSLVYAGAAGGYLETVTGVRASGGGSLVLSDALRCGPRAG